jgi:hypothetical protein
VTVPTAASSQRHFRSGDVVQVRDASEILATLDSEGRLDAMPFMPEMLRHVGRRFVVSARVEKICDTVTVGGGPKSRRMRDTVFLDDLRCDGSAHGGCQAGCRMYWKEAWLKPASVEPPPEAASAQLDALRELEQAARAQTSVANERDGVAVEVFSCQATEAHAATTALSPYDPGQYARELTSGNVRVRLFLRVALRALSFSIGRTLRRFLRVSRRALIGRKLRIWDYTPVRRYGGSGGVTAELLGLRPGDWVQVRTFGEIARTLDKHQKNRGLSFDIEMLPYCGGTFRVRDVVKRIIDETSGEMIEFGTDCIILEGVACSGDRAWGRWFCRRAIYPFWREAWLRRVDPPFTAQRTHRAIRPYVPAEQSCVEGELGSKATTCSCSEGRRSRWAHAANDALTTAMMAIRLFTQ